MSDAPRPSRAEIETEKAAVGNTLDHDCPRAVGKQDCRPPVGQVDEARQDLRADHERPLDEACGDVRVRLSKAVDEARRGRGQVVRGRVPCPEL